MYARHNIPTEIARTIIMVSETGSLTRAADSLGLSQPAVTSQIKRVEKIVGSTVFEKTPNGSKLTEVGKLVLAEARKIVEATDRVFALGGSSNELRHVRVGLSSILVREFMAKLGAPQLDGAQFQSDNSSQIAQSLLDGRIDIGCLFLDAATNPEIARLVVRQIELPLAWVRARSFVLSPGKPIPIVTWANDDWMMMRTLSRDGLSFRVAFSGQDFDAKRAAVEAGVGLTVVPDRFIPPSVIRANEYYLPKLPPIKLVLCLRDDAPASAASDMQSCLTSVFFADKVAGKAAGEQCASLQPVRGGSRAV